MPENGTGALPTQQALNQLWLLKSAPRHRRQVHFGRDLEKKAASPLRDHARRKRSLIAQGKRRASPVVSDSNGEPTRALDPAFIEGRKYQPTFVEGSSTLTRRSGMVSVASLIKRADFQHFLGASKIPKADVQVVQSISDSDYISEAYNHTTSEEGFEDKPEPTRKTSSRIIELDSENGGSEADSRSSKENHAPTVRHHAASGPVTSANTGSIDEEFHALLASMVREARAKDQAEIKRLQGELSAKAAVERSARALACKLRADLTKIYGKLKDVGEDLGQISDDIDMNFVNAYVL
ncbi:hypothetical protein HYPSUDRAFT_207579 [Hypholoma sublateritium FD-334 SS-4]|uniref:Uncharacterized protein n=1 Tax=Hypholoma sublateritium (strain FD-334 SS-4) TaxID=945553 RepID=A0A0D2P5U4_HYPSF|nr:hypothetical protein HYPSUDRAFT_207579 [Hypholoma sublateritium FD-334 SS-4]